MVPMADAGLGMLSAACLGQGADVTLVDWTARLSPALFVRLLREVRPEIVAVKVFTVNFAEAAGTLRMVREAVPEAVTVIGGPHPSVSRPQDVFAEFGDLLDVAVAGDGERALTTLVERVRERGSERAATASPTGRS